MWITHKSPERMITVLDTSLGIKFLYYMNGAEFNVYKAFVNPDIYQEQLEEVKSSMINSIGIVYLVPNVYFVLTIVGYRKFLATSSSCVFITRHALNTKVGKEFQVFLPPN